MSLTDKVRELLAAHESVRPSSALANAERLAERFSDVKPTPYVVPIERFVGMSVQQNAEKI